MDSHQPEVFEFSIRSTVDDILKGYNGTVFAYGQTGAGKSYTMMGDIDSDEQKGIIPRIVEQIFASILASPGNIEYTVRVGYMEIYMERIRDLLRPENDNLPIHEEKSRGVYVKELTELYVSSIDEVYEVMRRGAMTRAVAATNMNQESSRSHSIFVVTITQKNVETGSSKSGQLFLVDLAGSEKVGKTGASGQTLEEAKKINKSLSALGMVINALTDGKSTHIPYRDSKLTRILQESLGGNSRTTLIINCSPSSYNDQETISTLRFGVRAKSIKNKAKINAELSVTELKIMLKKVQTQVQTFEQYIQSLHGEVQQWRSGEAVPKEAWIQPLDGLSKKAEAKAPSTPSRGPAADVRRSDTPSRPDSRMELERAGTPSTLDKDEKDEFLRRENDLQDQLSERETQLADAEKALRDLRDELGFLREHDARATADGERLATEVNELRMAAEKLSFEAREDRITMDGLREANAELTAELDEVKAQLLESRVAAREGGGALDGKERLKRERMAEMMAGFDLGDGAPDGEEPTDADRLRAALASIDEMLDAEKTPAADASALQTLRQKLLEASPGVRSAASAAAQRAELEAAARARRDALEARLAKLQAEHEALLEGKLDGADVEALRARLADTYAARREAQEEKVRELEEELRRRVEDAGRLRGENEELRARVAVGAVNGGGVENGVGDGKAVERQIAEFDNMKKSLMRDLQNRCERVGIPSVTRGCKLTANRSWSSRYRSTRRASSTTTCSARPTTARSRRRWPSSSATSSSSPSSSGSWSSRTTGSRRRSPSPSASSSPATSASRASSTCLPTARKSSCRRTTGPSPLPSPLWSVC
jgi:kinesin family protein 5